jgi:hypothetical protein
MGSKRLPPSMMADGNGYEQRNKEKDRLKKTYQNKNKKILLEKNLASRPNKRKFQPRQ